MSNFNKIHVDQDARTELHDQLSLTGAEISINNEEIYAILSGKGKAVIDSETVELNAGDWIRIAPAAKRQFFAAADSGISYICIQVRENSLEEFTVNDAEISQ